YRRWRLDGIWYLPHCIICLLHLRLSTRQWQYIRHFPFLNLARFLFLSPALIKLVKQAARVPNARLLLVFWSVGVVVDAPLRRDGNGGIYCGGIEVERLVLLVVVGGVFVDVVRPGRAPIVHMGISRPSSSARERVVRKSNVLGGNRRRKRER